MAAEANARQRRDEPRDQGKPQQACELLAHLGWLRNYSDTNDLKEAKKLLSELV